MEERFLDVRSARNPRARIKVLEGHFATSHSHVSTYIDMSTVKHRHQNARETARELVHTYQTSVSIDTIVCMDGTEVIAAFMAEFLSDNSSMSLNSGKTISIITPEINQMGQLIFRDNTQRMVKHMQILLLVASATTGRTIDRALECIEYYEGTICGISAIFSAAKDIHGVDINTIFSADDLPNYRTYPHNECPYCKQGSKVEALINSYGYSKL